MTNDVSGPSAAVAQRAGKHFNTAGPQTPWLHYSIDPLVRIDAPMIEDLIDQQRYFVLHAPRQTGKTTCLLALRDALNARGRYAALYVNVEAAQTANNDVAAAAAFWCNGT